MKKERRTCVLELRAANRSGAPCISGHAAVFNSSSELLGGCFREIIRPGAFAEAIRASDVRALFNHNPDYVLGRTSAGTLRLLEDEDGLAIEIDPPDTTVARDLQVSMKRGDIKEMSFGFTVADGGDTWEKDSANPGMWTRTINRVERLYDVSPVTYPAYPETDCALRSLDAVKEKEVPKTNEVYYRRLRLEMEAAL